MNRVPTKPRTVHKTTMLIGPAHTEDDPERRTNGYPVTSPYTARVWSLATGTPTPGSHQSVWPNHRGRYDVR